jgi:CBS domain-containing protein
MAAETTGAFEADPVAGSFDFTSAPYDALTPAERQKIVRALDIAYYPAGVRLLQRGDRPEHLFIVIKGIVDEHAGEELVDVHVGRDAFDAQALIVGEAANTLTVREELVCYLLPRRVFLDLVAGNAAFGAFHTDSVADRLRARAAREESRQLAGFLVARVKDAAISDPVFVEPRTPLNECARLMRAKRAHTLLVADGARTGLLSRTDLSDAVLLHGCGVDAPVGQIARYELVTIALDAPLAEALFLMTKHRIRRIVVTHIGAIAGVLELPALLGYLSDNSHFVSVQIMRAETIDELKRAAAAIERFVGTMFAAGTRLSRLAPIVAELDRSLLARLFAVAMPTWLGSDACLVVMGSEGRGEQTLRTDQDNALVLRDGVPVERARRAAEEFSARLAELGFPPCPGDMMLSNPAWTRTISDFRDQVHRWVALSGEDSFLPLAALADAMPVAGDAALGEELRTFILDRVRGDDAFLAKFARATLSFETPRLILPEPLLALTEWRDGIDLKKAGIFPIVHGARSMALKHGIRATPTLERLATLVDRGVLDARFVADLSEAFEFLLHLRLKTELERRGAARAAGGRVDLGRLQRRDARLLKDAFQVVIRFKEQVSHHFRLRLF